MTIKSEKSSRDFSRARDDAIFNFTCIMFTGEISYTVIPFYLQSKHVRTSIIAISETGVKYHYGNICKREPVCCSEHARVIRINCNQYIERE